MALMGLVRVSTKGQDVARKHEILEPISVKVFEEHVSSKLKVDDRPGLTVALDYLRDGGMLTVQEVDRLGRNLVEGLVVRNDLFKRGIAVKVMDGIAAAQHTERSFVLDMALALAEDRRRVTAARRGVTVVSRCGRSQLRSACQPAASGTPSTRRGMRVAR